MHLKNDFGLKGIYFHIREPSKKWDTENANTYKKEIVNNELFFFQRPFQIIKQNLMCFFPQISNIFTNPNTTFFSAAPVSQHAAKFHHCLW